MSKKEDKLPETFPGRKYALTMQASADAILAEDDIRRPVRSSGTRFLNVDAWTGERFVHKLTDWLAANPGALMTEHDLEDLIYNANKAYCRNPYISVARMPQRVDHRVALAIVGGGYHEAWHTKYSRRSRIELPEVAFVLEIVNRVVTEGGTWDAKMRGLLKSVHHLVEDIRIERRGCEDYPGAYQKMCDLQDFILDMEMGGRLKGSLAANVTVTSNARSILLCAFRDLGLGYNTAKAKEALAFYKQVSPEAISLVAKGGLLRPLLEEAKGLTVEDDLGSIRVGMELVATLWAAMQADLENMPKPEDNCPACDASPSNLLIKSVRNEQGVKIKGKAKMVCKVCGHEEEFDLPDTSLDLNQNHPEQDPDKEKPEVEDLDQSDLGEHSDGFGDDVQEHMKDAKGGIPQSEPEDADGGDSDGDDEDLEPSLGSESDSEGGAQDNDDADGFGEEGDEDGGNGGEAGEGDETEGDTEGGMEGADGDSNGADGNGEADDDAEGTEGGGDSEEGEEGEEGEEDGFGEDDEDGDFESEGGDFGDEDGSVEDGDEKGGDSNSAGSDDSQGTGGDDAGGNGDTGDLEDHNDVNVDAKVADSVFGGDEDDDPLNNSTALEAAVKDQMDKDEDVSYGEDERPWNPANPDLDVAKFVRPKSLPTGNGLENATRKAKAMHREVGNEITMMRARLRNIVRALENTDIEHGLRRGRKISDRMLVDSRIDLLGGRDPSRAYQDQDAQLDTSVAMAICVDQSGSMRGHEADSAKMMMVLTEPLEAIKGKTFAFGFRTGKYTYYAPENHSGIPYHRTEGVRYDVYKGWDERFDRIKWRFARVTSSGGTPMADGVQYGLAALNPRQEAHRILAVITDGCPNSGHEEVMRYQIRKAKEAGIHVLGIGLGYQATYVKDVFPDHVWVPNMSEAPAALIKKLNELCDFSGKHRGKRIKGLQQVVKRVG
jgi:hypothetical protein